MLFFFYLLVYFYLLQFFFLHSFVAMKLLWGDFFVFMVDVFGFCFNNVLTYVISGFYFIVMLFVCYTGHFSWSIALGRMVEFVFIWSLVSWFMVVMIYMSEEVMSNILGLYGEGVFGVLYSVWGKSISVLVRPLSLALRLMINLLVGHFFMLGWILMSWGGMFSFVWLQFVLLLIVFYEFFVFFLQSFIFSRLLGVYMEES